MFLAELPFLAVGLCPLLNEIDIVYIVKYVFVSDYDYILYITYHVYKYTSHTICIYHIIYHI